MDSTLKGMQYSVAVAINLTNGHKNGDRSDGSLYIIFVLAQELRVIVLF